MTGGGPFDWRPGQPTDDTGLTIAVAQAHAADPHRPHLAARRRFEAWYDGELLGEWPRDVGGATARGINGHPDPDAQGNGALMRCAPTALRHDAAHRTWAAWEIAGVTHPHLHNRVACAAYVEIAAHLVAGDPVDLAVQVGIDTAERWSPVIADLIWAAARTARPAQLLTDGASGFVLDSLVLAVHAVATAPNFSQGLVDVIRYGRDTDTNGAIAGGLLGARFGQTAIPARWVNRLEWGAWLADTADALHR